MKVSVNWIKQFLDFELPAIDVLTQHIGAQLGGVDGVEYIGEKYRGAVIVQVVSCEPHPDSDHMHVCRVDDGGVTPDVSRGDDGLVQVVCGAPNVRTGLRAVWLPPGSTVPESWSKEPFVLGARELRGVTSNGMLASPKELAIGESHEGIVEVEEDKLPGTSLVDAYQLDDYIIDIENKMFTHRPDCFGQLGIAREIAGILGKQFVSPEWVIQSQLDGLTSTGTPLSLKVINEVPNLVPRFMAVALDGIDVKPSPLQFQSWLARLGVRPINNVVDVTNYIMMLTGQPLHAYDYKKLASLSGDDGAVIAVRHPRSGEKVSLLNGKTIQPREEAIVIATDKQLIGVGGAMGGSETEVDDQTTSIVLEVATFDMYSIRRTSMAHGLFTEAVTRFNKGQSPLQNDEVLAQSIRLLQTLSGAHVASGIFDNNHVDQTRRERRWVHLPVPIATAFINARLGVDLSAEAVKVLLENVEFAVAIDGDNLTVTAPFWRTDVETREDVVEEVGRLYGFDKLPLELPKRSVNPASKDTLLELKARLRSTLVGTGANEVLTYSFVHGTLLEKSGQDTKLAFQVGNALSPDLQYYRVSLTPSLLDKIHMNIKAGYDQFALFEIGKAHVHGEHDSDEPDVPKEVDVLSYVYASKPASVGAPYYQARKILMHLMSEFQAWQSVTLVPLQEADLGDSPWVAQLVAPFEPSRSAIIRGASSESDTQGKIWGIVGEYTPTVRRALKLPDTAAGFEIDPTVLLGKEKTQQYVVLPRFPKVTQDITLKVPTELTYQALYEFMWEQVQRLRPEATFAQLAPLDIYQKQDDAAHKQVSFRLSIASHDRTLTDKEVTNLLALVAGAAKEQFGAEQV